ncbi:MAG: hypothetical protein A3F18_00240 [Legionellales bacterium RIFCSPHIGHO2_12_FULL_37_14]|nr:MAG: hypothetical protein A3F18_00240 [Legionellales bacterium RIFCSPHIGHO2_12_FULL_37_14]
MLPKLLVINTTVESLEQAELMAKALVNEKLAACVHYSAINSMYRWQGKVEKASEWSLRIKADLSMLENLLKWIAKNHPYEVPELWWQEATTTSEYAEYIQGT